MHRTTLCQSSSRLSQTSVYVIRTYMDYQRDSTRRQKVAVSRLKAFADDKSNITQNIKFVIHSEEN